MTVAARGPVGGMAAGGLVVTGGNDLVRLDSGKAICHQMPPGNPFPHYGTGHSAGSFTSRGSFQQGSQGWLPRALRLSFIQCWRGSGLIQRPISSPVHCCNHSASGKFTGLHLPIASQRLGIKIPHSCSGVAWQKLPTGGPARQPL